MDDLAHESRPIHSLNRKRKADQDDRNVSPTAQDPADPAEPMLIDVQATPRCPTDPAPGPSSPSWPIARSRQSMSSSWPPQPSSSCTPTPAFIPQRPREGQPSPKRLRIQIPNTPPTSPHRPRRSQRQPSSRHLSRHRRPGDTRDTGIVSATEPGPSRGSLLRTASLPSLPSHSSSRSVPVSPIEPITTSPHIPPHQPPINRETLKELDLEAILRNPQLRHDLLFDSGLQFRPTSSRRKRDLADNYWLAIVRELECGCTCTTLDANDRLAERRCACRVLPLPTDRPTFACSTGNMKTVRTPSRIRPLLHELLEVLVSIIQPAQPPTTRPPELLFPPPPQHPQFQQNVAHVVVLRQLLDPDLIQQEIDHGLFDPSGVFQSIGDIIRCHCAPMRDAAVDQMVALARSCAPGGTGTKLDAVRAIRMCFEIMELMKLDVANHQLQTLRPYLVRTAAQYEIRTFQETRLNGQPSTLHATRAWLKAAYQDLASSPGSGSSLHSQRFLQYPRQTRVLITVVKAVVNLIFDPPAPAPPHPHHQHRPHHAQPSAPSSTASTPTISSPAPALATSRSSSSHACSSFSASSFTGYPETFFLDYGRLATLSTDAADFTSLYMLLLLYRQLVHSHLHMHPHAHMHRRPSRVTHEELLRLKKEIWEIGPAHLGLCFVQAQNRPRATSGGASGGSQSHSGSGSTHHTSGSGSSHHTSSNGGSGRSTSRQERNEREREAEMRKWRAEVADVILQVTRRAAEPRMSGGVGAPQNVPDTADADASRSTADASSRSAAENLRAPDAETLKLTSSWAENNLRPGSALSALVKRRIRECVEEAVLAIVLPSSSSSSTASSGTESASTGDGDAGSTKFPTTPSTSPSNPNSNSEDNNKDNADADEKAAPPPSNGLEPLMPEIKHLAERAAKLVTIHANVYGALYAHPSFLRQVGDAPASSRSRSESGLGAEAEADVDAEGDVDAEATPIPIPFPGMEACDP